MYLGRKALHGRKMLHFSILLGLLIAIATSLVPNTCVIGEFPDVRFIAIPLIGVSYWGSPLPWLKQIVYPDAVKEVIWPHLAVDALFWIVVVFVVKLFYFVGIKGERLSGLDVRRARTKTKTKSKAKKGRRRRR